MSGKIHFLLNDQEICVEKPTGTLLDYLRKNVGLTGVKEGCKEGDCGACVVLIGELRMHYKSVTSCLVPLAEMQRRHVVTIEGVNARGLTPVQQVIFDQGGSQCGFCTPGIVLSLTCYLLENDTIDYAGMKNALSGHLCRCTGYSSLKRSGVDLIKLVRAWKELSTSNAKGRMEMLIEREVIPPYFREIPTRLRALADETTVEVGSHLIVAGGTDIYVQKGDSAVEAKVMALNRCSNWKGISQKNGIIHIGALTTFEEFSSHREIVQIIPEIDRYMHLIASLQIRNRATLGGNIVNASPIGDITILLLALNASVVLKKEFGERTVSLRKFFKGYKQLDKDNSEMVSEILLPIPSKNTKINFEKLSKRKCLDIATVNSAVSVKCDSQGVIEQIGMAMGGVASIPMYLENTCAHLIEKRICPETILGIFHLVQSEISPISDVRGSAVYKRLLARQFIIAHFTKLYPLYVKARAFYEAH